MYLVGAAAELLVLLFAHCPLGKGLHGLIQAARQWKPFPLGVSKAFSKLPLCNSKT